MIRENKDIKKLSVLVLLLSITFIAIGQTKRVRPSTEHLAFKTKMLINPGTGKTMKNVIIEVNNGRILKVVSADRYQQREGVPVVDVSTKYVIPGDFLDPDISILALISKEIRLLWDG